MKKLTLMMVLLLVGCATNPSSSSSTSTPNQMMTSSSETAVSSSQAQMIELTLEELKQFDGKNGRKAYIAVDGFIYDVSGSFNWFLGRHNGYEAGRDLTFEIDNISPHGRSKLEQVPQIGRIKP